MIVYKVNVAGIEMIVEANQTNLECIQNRNWEYTELTDIETTHTIEDFMGASLNELIKK